MAGKKSPPKRNTRLSGALYAPHFEVILENGARKMAGLSTEKVCSDSGGGVGQPGIWLVEGWGDRGRELFFERGLHINYEREEKIYSCQYDSPDFYYRYHFIDFVRFSSVQTPHRYPEFQPGIWDEAVIQFPENSSAGMNDYPFMFEYELNASRGFENVYRNYYRPTFVMSRGKTGTIMVNVTSHSTVPLTITLKGADDLPERIGVTLIPKTVVLKPGTSQIVQGVLDASGYGPDQTMTPITAEHEQKYPVGLWLEAGSWSIGQGFYLKMIP